MKLILIIVLAIYFTGCTNKSPVLSCTNVELIKDKITKRYGADRVTIESKVLKEEIYFKELRNVYITIYNPTMEALDFKLLQTDVYQRFDEYELIETKLGKEGEMILSLIKKNCDLNNFNNVMVVFGKNGDDGKLLYDFTVNYPI